MICFVAPGALAAPGVFLMAGWHELRALLSAYDAGFGLEILVILLLAELWLRWHLHEFRAENERLRRELEERP